MRKWITQAGRVAVLSTQVALAGPAQLAAQDTLPPWEGGLTVSLGQPSRTRLYAGASLGFDWRRGSPFEPTEVALLGVDRAMGNPVLGLFGVAGEAYGGLRSTRWDAGVRGLLQIPVLRLSLGGDYSLRDNRLGVTLAATLPLRRGGLLGRGDVFRLEWTTGSLRSARASVLLPVRRPAAGHTRPRTSRVDVPGRPAPAGPAPADTPELDTVLASVRQAARRIETLTIPFLDRPGADPRAALAPLIAELRQPSSLTGGPGLDVDGAVRLYHDELVRAFSIAATGHAVPFGSSTPEGAEAAARARASLRDHLLFPYDHLLGQWKTPGTAAGLAVYARGSFAREVVSLTALAPEREGALLHVFGQLLETVLQIERSERDRWHDSRLVWLPLQLGLRPEDHDTQAELDRIIEAVTGGGFSDGNRVWYVINEQFAAEVLRSIERAEDYHVLWIHDFAGRNDAGLPDAFSLGRMVATYLRVLARRVREYDRRRRLPVYMIFLDEHYYEANRSRPWLDLLERPLGPTPRLPAGAEDLEGTLAAAQQELRHAVAGSPLLQAEVQQYGEAWLHNLIQVHVSVTNPADPSFWSRQVVPLLGVPDNIMRDHRKIMFYDISEDDPYRGMAIYTGMGIGEHYTGPTWEDRSIMIQGPATLPLKARARQLLESQGIPPDRIPYPLKPRPLAPGYTAAVAREIAQHPDEQGLRAVDLHNLTGFADKQISAARGVLYSLMPPGAVVKVPDSLWGNSFYAALLVGSALRGCRVLFVAPSLAAAPAPGWPSMALTHDLFARLIVLQQELGPELEQAGGLLKTGFYNPGIGVGDVVGRFTQAYQNARRTPFLRRLFPVDPALDTLLVHLAQDLGGTADSIGAAPAPYRPTMPKLHLKASFFASKEGWERLVSRPEMIGVVQAYLAQLLRDDARHADVRTSAAALAEASERLEAGFLQSLPAAEREHVVYYLLVGSANQDYRSMLMDGEASVLLSGRAGVVGLIDFSLIVSLSVWIDDLETLDALLPPPSGLQRAIARQARPAL